MGRSAIPPARGSPGLPALPARPPKSLDAHLRLWGLSLLDIKVRLAAAREQSLLYGEHTWGGSLSWITSYGKDLSWCYGDAWKAERQAGRFKRLEESWAEHTRYIETTEQILRPALDGLMTTLGRSVGATGPRVVVFNPLPWQRDGIVRLRFAGPVPAAVRPVDGGPAVPVERQGDEIVFLRERSPRPAIGRFHPPGPKTLEACPVSIPTRASSRTSDSE